MTQAEFQQIFVDIRDSIVDLIVSNTDPATTRVWSRDVFDENEPTWLGRLTADDGSVHCWSVSYTGCPGLDDEQNPTATETFVPTFRIIGYRAYNFGTDADNSSDAHLDEINKLRWAFLNDPTLALDDVVESHSGFIDQTMLGKIDTKSVHISRIDLGVQMHPIDYEYPS